jgi:hypothetical protein
MGKDSVSRQCFQKCWAAIISSELMEGPYPESVSFPLWFTQSQVIVLTWTLTPQKCLKYVDHPYHICPYPCWDQLPGLEHKDESISFLCGPVAHCVQCNSAPSLGR